MREVKNNVQGMKNSSMNKRIRGALFTLCHALRGLHIIEPSAASQGSRVWNLKGVRSCRPCLGVFLIAFQNLTVHDHLSKFVLSF